MNKLGVFSVPRSGSTWLGQILNSHPNVLYRFQPNFAYSFDYTLSSNSSKTEISDFFKNLILSNDDFVNGKISISSKKNVVFNKKEKTTLVFKETHYIEIIENLILNTDIKIIGLIRSPFAVINSWSKIPKEFNPSWDLLKEWRYAQSKNQNNPSFYFGYEKWKETAKTFLSYKERHQDQFYIVDYSSLLKNTQKEIEKLFNFCKLGIDQQTLEFINQSKSSNNADPYSIFKNKKNDNQWKNKLPISIIKAIKNDQEFIDLNKKFKWL